MSWEECQLFLSASGSPILKFWPWISLYAWIQPEQSRLSWMVPKENRQYGYSSSASWIYRREPHTIAMLFSLFTIRMCAKLASKAPQLSVPMTAGRELRDSMRWKWTFAMRILDQMCNEGYLQQYLCTFWFGLALEVGPRKCVVWSAHNCMVIGLPRPFSDKAETFPRYIV